MPRETYPSVGVQAMPDAPTIVQCSAILLDWIMMYHTTEYVTAQANLAPTHETVAPFCDLTLAHELVFDPLEKTYCFLDSVILHEFKYQIRV